MRIGTTTALAASVKHLRALVNAELYVTLPPSLITVLDDEPTAMIKCIGNRYTACGYFGSIKTIIELLNVNTHGIFIAPVDAPIVDRQLLWAMANIASARRDPLIIVPHWYPWPGHPVYLSRHFFDPLRSFHGAHGLRSFIGAHRAYARALLWPDRRLLANYNYPRDLIAYAS